MRAAIGLGLYTRESRSNGNVFANRVPDKISSYINNLVKNPHGPTGPDRQDSAVGGQKLPGQAGPPGLNFSATPFMQ
jgi:hypothetical protein